MACTICKGKKLLPFKRKDGSILPHAWIDCECKQEEPVRFRNTRPEDFDFPVSGAFREYTFGNYGRPWEKRSASIPQVQPEAKAPESQPWDKRQQYQIDQTRAELTHIKQKLLEITGKKPRQKPSDYKGLIIE